MRRSPAKSKRLFLQKLAWSLGAGSLGAVVFFFLGLGTFMNYGGNSCDQPPAMTCDCFCCHMFELRGYESCGKLGALIGAPLGFILGFGIVFALWGRKS